ncbi:MAG: SpoVA/SpoVAEb family sporulation membrane protein [Clostridia bacterium]|nr:SpoVA/SpoVAEb family sporulation membrane protein [Clostridia bacterium]
MEFLIVFAVGGGICVLGQLLINFTKMTSARILVIFLLLGVVLEACGVFEPIKQAVHAGVTIPITGFGSTLAKGAIKGAKEKGLLGAITGGTEAAGAGIAGAIFIGFVSALLGKPKTKD